MMPEPPPTDACLFLDVDGTLIDIAPTPTSVEVPPSLIDALRGAESVFGGALALVSGRSIAELDRLFQPLHLRASGVHGAEFRFGQGDGTRWTKAEPIPGEVWDDLLDLLQAFPDSLVENKGFSFAVHYRAAPETGSRLREALELFVAARVDRRLTILPGHFVYEVKRPDIDKGAAIAEFMRRPPFAGRRPVFIGDDVTDTPGFVAVNDRGGLAYSVSHALPGVLATFSDPAAVRRWLADIDRSERVTA